MQTTWKTINGTVVYYARNAYVRKCWSAKKQIDYRNGMSPLAGAPGSASRQKVNMTLKQALKVTGLAIRRSGNQYTVTGPLADHHRWQEGATRTRYGYFATLAKAQTFVQKWAQTP